jgi:alginate O-acetyltransferase complex protein AlgI
MRLLTLLLGSLGIYALLAGWLGLIQILLATTLAWLLALWMDRSARASTKKAVAFAGVLLLVAHLLIFKLVSTNSGASGTWSSFIAPVGISFYTLHLISYLVDVYRGSPSERQFGALALVVVFFPKVISGPIERTASLISQLRAPAPLTRVAALSFIEIIAWGAFKKIAVADQLAPMVDRVFDNPGAQDGVSTVFATVVYAFQIYCDFSGYADMAIGIAGLLGFRLSTNFDRPYFATTLPDFWRRWHASFAAWLGEYVYTPLLKQRLVRIKLYNMMLIGVVASFFISGLWHGIRWHFIAWGLLHGLYLAGAILLQQPWRRFADRIGLKASSRLHRAIKIAFTFTLICSGYLLFRANSIGDAWSMLTHFGTGWTQFFSTIGKLTLSGSGQFLLAIAGVVFVMGSESVNGRIDPVTVRTMPSSLRMARFALCVVAVCYMLAAGAGLRPFIYYQF